MRHDIGIIVSSIILGILIGLCFRGCGSDTPHKTSVDSIVNVAHRKSDSIMNLTIQRDSLLALLSKHSDTIIKVTTNYINRYKNSTDTIVKIQACDSIVIGFENLQRDYATNDSLHIKNEEGLKVAVGILTTALDTVKNYSDHQQVMIDELQSKVKRNRRIAIAASVGASALAVLVWALR